MFIVDSHCHLDSLDYQQQHQDLDEVIDNAQRRDVRFMLGVATTLQSYLALKKLTAGYEQIRLSCGVHPLNLQDESWSFEQLSDYATDSRVIAIGETGLDYYYQQDNKSQQQEAFCQQISLGRQLNKPVIVHTRQAIDDTLSLLAKERVADCGGVLHCFTEDKTAAGKLLDMGMYISFSGIVTFRNAEQIREAARYVPLERILVETDSPYLAPVPYRGKANQPAYTRDVAEYLAVVKGVDVERLAQQTTDNFCQLFHVDIQ